MKLDWSSIAGYVISGAVVSWPVFIAGLWLNHRRTGQHVDRVTERQTAEVKQITESQTETLLGGLSRAYHQHGTGEAEEAGIEGRDPAAPGDGPEGLAGSREPQAGA